MLLSRLPLNMLPPQAVLLAADVALLSLPQGEAAEAHLLAGRSPPYGTVEVQSESGPHRIAALRLSEQRGPHGTEDDPLGPVVLGADVAELADELDLASRQRLLGFLLGFCRRAFDLSGNQDFAASCLRLAQLCVIEAGRAEPVASVTPSWTVLSGARVAADASVFILGANRVRRSVAPRLQVSDALHLIERVRLGETILALGDRPAMWTVAPPRTGLRDLLPAQPDRDGLRAAALRALAPVCPVVAGRLRETSLLTPAAPRRHDDPRRPLGAALEAALPDGEGNIFLRGWLRDPMDLVEAVELAGDGGRVTIAPSQLHRFRRRDLDEHFAAAAFADLDPRIGFVAHVPDPSAGLGLQPTLSLRLQSGARVDVSPALRHPTPAAARNGRVDQRSNRRSHRRDAGRLPGPGGRRLPPPRARTPGRPRTDPDRAAGRAADREPDRAPLPQSELPAVPARSPGERPGLPAGGTRHRARQPGATRRGRAPPARALRHARPADLAARHATQPRLRGRQQRGRRGRARRRVAAAQLGRRAGSAGLARR